MNRGEWVLRDGRDSATPRKPMQNVVDVYIGFGLRRACNVMDESLTGRSDSPQNSLRPMSQAEENNYSGEHQDDILVLTSEISPDLEALRR